MKIGIGFALIQTTFVIHFTIRKSVVTLIRCRLLDKHIYWIIALLVKRIQSDQFNWSCNKNYWTLKRKTTWFKILRQEVVICMFLHKIYEHTFKKQVFKSDKKTMNVWLMQLKNDLLNFSFRYVLYEIK